MFGWAVGGGLVPGSGGRRGGWGRLRASGIPVVSRGLIELKFGLGRTPGGGHPGRPMGQVEVEEDVLHGGREGDERYDPHLATAGGAQEREHFVDASQELGPEDAARS
jgi:hypothetical protein